MVSGGGFILPLDTLPGKISLMRPYSSLIFHSKRHCGYADYGVTGGVLLGVVVPAALVVVLMVEDALGDGTTEDGLGANFPVITA